MNAETFQFLKNAHQYLDETLGVDSDIFQIGLGGLTPNDEVSAKKPNIPQPDLSPRPAPLNSTTPSISSSTSSSTSSFTSSIYKAPTKLASPNAATANAEIEHLNKRVFSCQNCSLAKGRKHHVPFGYLKDAVIPERPLMVLNDIPAFEDTTGGRIFSAGNLFVKVSDIVKAIGHDLLNSYITSCFKCSSTTELPHDLSDLKICLEYLHAEIALVKPAAILAFGVNTHRALFPESDFTNDHGKLLNYHNTPIVFTVHPKEIFLNDGNRALIWKDLKPHLVFFKAIANSAK